MSDDACRMCGSVKIWVPTYCNFGHCAMCFVALDEEHDECTWDGSEHESYGPTSSLPGNVFVRGEVCDLCGSDEDVILADDPWTLEMTGKKVEMSLCHECYCARVDDT